MEKVKRFLSEARAGLSRVDYVVIGILTVAYGVISFVNLGNTTAPQTFETISAGEMIDFYFAEKEDIARVMLYNGEHAGTYELYYFTEGEGAETNVVTSALGTETNTEGADETPALLTAITDTNAFYWTQVDLDNTVVDHLRIRATATEAELGEVGFWNEAGERVYVAGIGTSGGADDSVSSASSGAATEMTSLLLDEQTEIPERRSYMNSTYFDEIYFARTAYEYANNLEAYEWVHPPLGKLLQAIPIQLFGMAPFFWRLGGNICGILMIPIIYALAKRLFKKRKWAIFAALLMALDTFHFAHTRMGTIDSYLVLFCMLEALFMLRYLQERRKSDLVWSGMFMGCGIATKWSGAFTALGIATIFLLDFFRGAAKRKTKLGRFVEKAEGAVGAVSAKATEALGAARGAIGAKIGGAISAATRGASGSSGVHTKNGLAKLVAVCVGSFIAIPVVIYFGSYMLFPDVQIGYATHLVQDANGNVYCDLSGGATTAGVSASGDSGSGSTNAGGSGVSTATAEQIAAEVIDTPTDVLCQAQGIMNYHSTMTETRWYGSPWYSWLISWTPVWYYQYIGVGEYETISGVGNLAVFILGAIGAIYIVIELILKTVRKRRKGVVVELADAISENRASAVVANIADAEAEIDEARVLRGEGGQGRAGLVSSAAFIVIMIGCSLLPYIFIGREMYLYHYFPTLPFVMIAGAYMMSRLEERMPRKAFRAVSLAVLLLVVMFFVAYFPVVSGETITQETAKGLQIFPKWYF